jgi:hypothetical protein
MPRKPFALSRPATILCTISLYSLLVITLFFGTLALLFMDGLPVWLKMISVCAAIFVYICATMRVMARVKNVAVNGSGPPK